MWRQFFVLFTVLIWSSPAVMGQSKKAVLAYESAVQSAQRSDWERALNFVETALQREPKYGKAALLKADIFMQSDRAREALAAYRDAFQRGAGPVAWLRRGQLAMEKGWYAVADTSLSQYIATTPGSDSRYTQEAKHLLRSAHFGMEAMKNPSSIHVKDLGDGVNVFEMNYFPFPSPDDSVLLFTGRNPSGSPFDENIYTVRRVSAEAWGSPVLLPGRLNSPSNEGAVAVRGDVAFLIFSGCDRPEGMGSCDLYASHLLSDGSWSSPISLGDSINTPQWETQPTLSADGKTLLFVRAATKSKNNSSIFISRLTSKGHWTRAIPLPGLVNSPGAEISPFLHADGNTLYFSSDGHVGMGRRDIFVSRRLENGTWSSPVNLGYPINSHEDDFGLAVAPDGVTGYIGRGNKNVRLMAFGLPAAVQAQPVAWMEAIALDSATHKPVSAHWKIESDDFFQGLETKGISLSTALPAQKTYSLQVAAAGYALSSDRFSVAEESQALPLRKTYRLKRLENDQRLVLNNVFFETDSVRIEAESRGELRAVALWLNANPTVFLTIEGHTDNVGNVLYNKELSQRRASSVVAVLISFGISKERLLAQGFGQERPRGSNSTPEGRAGNRRTEMRIRITP